MQRPVHDHLQVMAVQQNGIQERKGSSTSQQAYISQGIFICSILFLSLSLSLSLSLRLPVSFHSWLVFLIDVPVNFEHWKGLFVNSIFEKD